MTISLDDANPRDRRRPTRDLQSEKTTDFNVRRRRAAADLRDERRLRPSTALKCCKRRRARSCRYRYRPYDREKHRRNEPAELPRDHQ